MPIDQSEVQFRLLALRVDVSQSLAAASAPARPRHLRFREWSRGERRPPVTRVPPELSAHRHDATPNKTAGVEHRPARLLAARRLALPAVAALVALLAASSALGLWTGAASSSARAVIGNWTSPSRPHGVRLIRVPEPIAEPDAHLQPESVAEPEPDQDLQPEPRALSQPDLWPARGAGARHIDGVARLGYADACAQGRCRPVKRHDQARLRQPAAGQGRDLRRRAEPHLQEHRHGDAEPRRLGRCGQVRQARRLLAGQRRHPRPAALC